MLRTASWARRFLLGTSIVGVVIAVLAVGAGNAANPGTNGKIAYSGSGLSGLWSISPDGTDRTRLLQYDTDWDWYAAYDAFRPAWSPDGTRLAFNGYPGGSHPDLLECSDEGIWSVSVDSGEVENVYCPQGGGGPPGNPEIVPYAMSWSPDGSTIVLDDAQRAVDQGVWGERVSLLDVATGARSTLVQAYVTDPAPLCPAGTYSEAVAGGAWSPLGDRIAFVRDATVDYPYGECPAMDGIWTIAPTGSGLTQLTMGDHAAPDWSPDGSKLVFVAVDDDPYGRNWLPLPGAIYVVDADGGPPTLLRGGSNVSPVWSPDGTKIAFISISGSNREIVVMDADGSNPQSVPNTSDVRQGGGVSWQPVVSSDPDTDNDGVDDSIDTGVGAFDDGDGTAGSIVDAALLDVFVTDADDSADGVKITVGPGSGKAKLSVCGFTIQVSAGSEVVVTCGSVTMEVVSGAAAIELSASVVVSVSAGGLAKATDNGDGSFEIQNLGTTSVIVTVDGQETTVAPGESTTVSTDTTDPTITGSAAPAPDGLNGWNLGNVTVSFTCLDAESGIDSCTAPVTLSSEGAGQSVTGTAVDNAGNSASTTVTGVKIDKTNPSLACIPATFVLNQPGATVSASVSDTVSGPAAATASSPVTTSSVGTFTAAVTGADTAGRTTTVACGYQVRYVFTGFQQPIDNPPVENRETAGAKIPVRWQITDYNGVGVSSPSSFASVTWTTIACSPTAPQDAIETGGTGQDLRYLGNGNWQYNWKTLKSFKKTCVRMQLNLADGVAGRVAIFRFK